MAWNPKAGPNRQHPPEAGSHGQDKPSKHGGDQGGAQFVHPSLRGESKPDKPGTARPSK